MSSSEEEVPPAVKPMRLQRFLAQCGLGSRRECEELITAGRVSIDGVSVAAVGATVDPSRQKVEVDGERLKVERKKYYVLNKPSGFLCTAKDPQGRRTVLDLLPSEGPRLFTVGRLDENTTGLLVVTNDGDLAQKLAHPRYRIFRLYRAQVAGVPDREIFEQLKQGLFFTEGRFRVHDVVPVKKQKDSTWVEITMTEGQNREIRRLFARVGHKIMKLERIGYGPLRLGRLPIGAHRDLTRDELGELHAILERNQSSSGNLTVTDRRPAGSSRAAGGPGRAAPKAAGGIKRTAPQQDGKPAGEKPSGSRGKPARFGQKRRPSTRGAARVAKPRRGRKPRQS